MKYVSPYNMLFAYFAFIFLSLSSLKSIIVHPFKKLFYNLKFVYINIYLKTPVKDCVK